MSDGYVTWKEYNGPSYSFNGTTYDSIAKDDFNNPPIYYTRSAGSEAYRKAFDDYVKLICSNIIPRVLNKNIKIL